jgi:hypothetical protein
MHATNDRMHHAIPILRVEDIETSFAYYTEKLGFKLDWRTPVFGSVTRGMCSVMLCEGGQGHAGTWLWIPVADSNELHEEYVAKGANILQGPANYESGRWSSWCSTRTSTCFGLLPMRQGRRMGSSRRTEPKRNSGTNTGPAASKGVCGKRPGYGRSAARPGRPTESSACAIQTRRMPCWRLHWQRCLRSRGGSTPGRKNSCYFFGIAQTKLFASFESPFTYRGNAGYGQTGRVNTAGFVGSSAVNFVAVSAAGAVPFSTHC